MKFRKIYLEGNDTFINEVLELGRKNLGDGCNAIDLDPKLKEEEEN